jgi:hypothetical protein
MIHGEQQGSKGCVGQWEITCVCLSHLWMLSEDKLAIVFLLQPLDQAKHPAKQSWLPL